MALVLKRIEYLQNQFIRNCKERVHHLLLHRAGDILDEDDADRNEAGQDNQEGQGWYVGFLQVNLIKLHKGRDPGGDFL